MKVGDVVRWKKGSSYGGTSAGIGTVLSTGIELDSLSLREVSICTIYSGGRIFKIPKLLLEVIYEPE